MDALLSAAQWVVTKALGPVADGVLEAWVATKNLGVNIEALRMELLLVKATLETASHKQVDGPAMQDLLGKLRDSARSAEDLLDEVDYFRIHDQLHGTYDTADQHAKGYFPDLALNARHAAKAVGKLAFISSFCCSAPSLAGHPRVEDARQRTSCCDWPRARERSSGSSSSATNTTNEVSGCMPRLGKLLPCSSFPHVRDDNSGQPTLCGAPQRETPMLGFNRVHVSQKMKCIVEQLQHVRTEFTKILQSCGRRTVPDIAKTRPSTTCQTIEPKLYGRDHIMDTIIHDMTTGKYNSKDLTVLPIVGPGGIGKTTLIQHIYTNQLVQNHFQVVIWVCVSLQFNLNKLLEEIKTCIPRVDGEKDGRAEELIEQRLKCKRYLLVLDDIWDFSCDDDWEKLLLPLKTSQEKGSMILVTTRFPTIAKIVGTTDHPIELEGLESEYIRELFHAFVFADDQCKKDHIFLHETGDKIMAKLKGSPLAAKTVGRLLRNNLNLCHWIRVLESKEWERKSGANDIMSALRLSYDYLPYHQQRCFSYSALFPEDHKYSATELINLRIGLDILQSGSQNETLEDIGLSNLNDLVTHGFFREEKTNGRVCYVMHDLLHVLALNVASKECLTLHHSNLRLAEIHPSICHLSIFIDYGGTSSENFGSELRKLKTVLKVKQLKTLMLFGKMDESLANILSDLFREANALRFVHLVDLSYSVESILPSFSALVHLRYLCLGAKNFSQLQLPLGISRLYHLRILDLRLWCGYCNLPRDLSNLAKLRRFYTRRAYEHAHIFNVGKLILLEELKEFEVNRESEGFEAKQLENLNELRELGIHNLENIHTKEEAMKAKLIDKNYLERLTLGWDRNRTNMEPDVEAVVLESLQPHRYLQELSIWRHGGPSCPTWLGDKLAVEALQSIHLSSVSWEHLPPFGKMWGLGKVILQHIPTIKEFVIEQSFCRLTRLELVGLASFEKWVPSKDSHHMFPLLRTMIIEDCPRLSELPFTNHIAYVKPDQDWNSTCFPKLRVLRIEKCPELLSVAHIPWTENMCSVDISDIKLLRKFKYSRGYFGMKLEVSGMVDEHNLDKVLAFSNLLQLKRPVEDLVVSELCGKDLSELLTHLPRVSKFIISSGRNITELKVGHEKAAATSVLKEEKAEDGLLIFPAHLSDSLREMEIWECPELVLADSPSTCLPDRGGGGLQALRSLQKLEINRCPKFLLSTCWLSSPSCCPFPSSLQELNLAFMEGIGTLQPLSNLTSLTRLTLCNCGEDLRCKGMGSLLAAGGQLRDLVVYGSPKFFSGWDPNHRQIVSPSSSFKLSLLCTDEVVGLLAAPICSLLSSSLTKLRLYGTYTEMEHFTDEQEHALDLLASLQELHFSKFSKLLSLPTGLHKLTSLKQLEVSKCPAIQSLPKDGLPKSLQELDVSECDNEDLKQQCRGLVGIIPNIKLH